ncbi:MAG: HAD family hydrolase, partial [Acutalibacteraceae bacterium]
MYKNYLFDLYGTLIDINTDEEDESLWEKLSLFYSYQGACYSTEGITDLYKKLCSKEKEKVRKRFPSYTNIDINIEKVFKELYEEKGVSPSVEMVFLTCNLFRCLSTKYIRLYKGVEDLLKTLKEKDKKVYLLSNAQRSFTYGELKRFDLIKYFDDIFISSDHLCSKPDPEFYNAL